MNRRFVARTATRVCIISASLALLGGGCSDPTGDFDSYAKNAHGTTGVPSNGGGGQGAGASMASDIGGTFLALCLPSATLTGGNTKYALRFFVKNSYSADADGTGSLSLAMTPLKQTAVTLNDVSPPEVDAAPTHVAADGTFHATFASVVSVPSDANPVPPGGDILIESGVFDGVVQSKDHFCAGLSGHVSKPIPFDLLANENICVFLRTEPGAALPATPAAADFHCP